MDQICQALLLDIPYVAAKREVIEEYDWPAAANSSAWAILDSVSYLVALLDIPSIYILFLWFDCIRTIVITDIN